MDQSEEQSKKRKLDELSANKDDDKETPSTGDDGKQQQEDPATNEPDSEIPIENKDEAKEGSDPQNDETDKVEEEKKENDQVNSQRKDDEVMEESNERDDDKKDSTESSEKTTAAEGDDNIDAEKEYEKPKKAEEDTLLKKNEGDNPYESLRWIVVKNDGKPASMIKLVALKSLFSKQLPKMPRAYIARLVFDRRHTAIAILSDDPAVKDTDEEVIGSICYRAFPEMRFAEIAFCAVSATHQVKVCSVV
jgi:histone acetyltransferase